MAQKITYLTQFPGSVAQAVPDERQWYMQGKDSYA